jgi:polysaccharide export outer membrane protein
VSPLLKEVPPVETEETNKHLKAADEVTAEAPPIYPGDDLRFSVIGQAELSFEARVPQDGIIQYPMIGKVTLAGRPLEAVRDEIKSRLEQDYLQNADVTIQVKEYARKRVYVLGAVARPLDGDVPGGRWMTLLQAIAQAGGFREDAAKHRVVIFRLVKPGSSERIALPLNVAALQEGQGKDPVLMPEDIVLVPSRERVYVLGQVARPGAFVTEADHGLTASQAISLAGGFTAVANDSSVRLLRRDSKGVRRTYVLNLTRVVEGRAEEDVPLQPGDLLFVPESLF